MTLCVELAAASEYVEPWTIFERHAAQAWREVLGGEALSIDENVFDWGVAPMRRALRS